MSYNQVPQELTETDTPSSPSQAQKHHDSPRIYLLTAVVCFGGLLFGYDSGVIG